MAEYTNPDGRKFTIPTYSDFSNGPVDFKNFSATMPSYGSEIMTIDSGDAAYVQKHLSRVLWFQSGGEYTLNDTAPVGAQVSIATSGGFVSIMTDGVSAEPAQERLIRPYSVVTCTKVLAGMWLVAKGSGATGSYFNEATGGTVAEITDYNGTGEVWRTHTFTSNSTFQVTGNADPNGFRVLWVGAGGGGGYVNTGIHGGVSAPGGGAGRVVVSESFTIAAGAHAVTVGTSVSGNGGNTEFYGQTAPGGGVGGSVAGGGGSAGGSGGGGAGSHSTGGAGGAAVPGSPLPGYGANGGNAPTGGMASQSGGNAGGTVGSGGYYTHNISGTDTNYGRGGNASGGGGRAAGYGNGGNGQQNATSAGSSGIVVVAYQIG